MLYTWNSSIKSLVRCYNNISEANINIVDRWVCICDKFLCSPIRNDKHITICHSGDAHPTFVGFYFLFKRKQNYCFTDSPLSYISYCSNPTRDNCLLKGRRLTSCSLERRFPLMWPTISFTLAKSSSNYFSQTILVTRHTAYLIETLTWTLEAKPKCIYTHSSNKHCLTIVTLFSRLTVSVVSTE